jgi:hypothetical protein
MILHVAAAAFKPLQFPLAIHLSFPKMVFGLTAETFMFAKPLVTKVPLNTLLLLSLLF